MVRLFKNAGVIVNTRERAFERGILPQINYKEMGKIFRMKIREFHSYGTKVNTQDGVYYFKDNGADILAVAHLDSVTGFHHFQPVKMGKDTRIFSPVCDDRAGVYVILKYLTSLGLKYDILLTEGEESGTSTAAYFTPPPGKQYKWMFSFDRRGTNCVTYQYKSPETDKALRDVGLAPETGIFSDICYLEHLGCKGFNFGIGYYDYHSINAYVSKKEMLSQIGAFLKFYRNNQSTHFRHVQKYNVFTLFDGFSYDPGVKTPCFSAEELDFGAQLLDEVDGVTTPGATFSHSKFTTKMYSADLQNVIQYRLRYPKDNIVARLIRDGKTSIERGSEDSPEFKMGIGIVHHLDVRPNKNSSPKSILEAVEKDGKTAFLVEKCSQCGQDYYLTAGNLTGKCDSCQALVKTAVSNVSAALRKETSFQANNTKPIQKLTSIGTIKTKLPINFGGVQLEYRKKEDGKDWSWEVPEWAKIPNDIMPKKATKLAKVGFAIL